MTKKLPSEKTIAEDIQNNQIYPSTVRVEINDKIVKVLFRKEHDVTGKFGVLEKKSSKKNKHQKSKGNQSSDVLIKYTISTDSGDATIILDEFDRAVLGVCISEQKAGNLYTTVNVIYRALIGKVGNVGIRPMNNQFSAIRNSIKKLMGTIVDFSNLAESLVELGYIDDVNQIKIKTSSILPAILLDCKINGQLLTDVLYFDRQSPLLEIAERKNQIIRYPHELLNVPNLRLQNTPRVIALKNYVMRRICEIKLHKQLTPTITFDDVFKKMHIENSVRSVKADVRSVMVKFFDHLKKQNFIEDFELVQERGKFVSIKFTFNS